VLELGGGVTHRDQVGCLRGTGVANCPVSWMEELEGYKLGSRSCQGLRSWQ
jgi:hypothetical protein